MSRAYLFYILTFGAFIGGLWVILTLGAAMKAPDDLSGEWTVNWQGAPPPDVKDGSMKVTQSGRFFVVKFGNRPEIGLTLQKGWKGGQDGRTLQMALTGTIWSVLLHGDVPSGERAKVGQMQLELDGPSRHVGLARRNGWTPATQPAGVARAR